MSKRFGLHGSVESFDEKEGSDHLDSSGPSCLSGYMSYQMIMEDKAKVKGNPSSSLGTIAIVARPRAEVKRSAIVPSQKQKKKKVGVYGKSLSRERALDVEDFDYRSHESIGLYEHDT
ncbi:hypothetical protein V6N13_043975 [Hibiscus sabdariffa]|uniref:Uncharacterized protein n=1 Tax=Hibiscus sabdariffa TaxID=183260 RepID=A0ABR2RH75_9ROSI